MFKVSTRERNRGDLDSLRSKVDARLATLQARPGAICVVREQVFSELFDEIIRGVSATWWWPALCTSNRIFISDTHPRREDPIVYCIATDSMHHNHYQHIRVVALEDTFLDCIAYV